METKVMNISGFTVICDDAMPEHTMLVGRAVYDSLKGTFPDLTKITSITNLEKPDSNLTT